MSGYIISDDEIPLKIQLSLRSRVHDRNALYAGKVP